MSAKTTKTADTVKETNAAKTAPEKKKQGNVMYMGPTIAGVVKSSTIFKDGVLPEKVKECIAAFPIMERLFVSINDVPAASKELNKAQSVLGTIYTQTENKFK